MECNFVVGQKVVCIGECFPTHHLYRGLVPITKGTVLTVREITKAKRIDGKEAVGLRFKEIINPSMVTLHHGIWEFDYSPRKFRPVIQRKTDISIFKAMLNPSKEQVTA
ncbi:hypothetical protein G3A56_02100 [Rhizobium oryzihabitans]|uniref:Uncharacterized protein n=1 Tax=Rhizobium oryzihabitans TaxID=2267833 RepID=A0A7L5BDK0_9HYPH|nr:hypothetical protein [Rhizobium oryzihabitans]QIB36935.1 hypothetical protein G3A56_02100 [Rhizobium oryzihabitans]